MFLVTLLDGGTSRSYCMSYTVNEFTEFTKGYVWCHGEKNVYTFPRWMTVLSYNVDV